MHGLGDPETLFGERAAERRRLVEALQEGPERDAVRDPRVLQAMMLVPRHAFVPEDAQPYAYDDRPLPIGCGQTISQPYMVAKMAELLRITPDCRLLEIGTGSGYQAAVLSLLTPHVYTVEVVGELAEQAGVLLDRLGFRRIRRRIGDGALGWPEEAPFDRILLTCAAEGLPEALWEQLKPGGRALYPQGSPHAIQVLTLVEKTFEGEARETPIMPVAFVPLVSA